MSRRVTSTISTTYPHSALEDTVDLTNSVTRARTHQADASNVSVIETSLTIDLTCESPIVIRRHVRRNEASPYRSETVQHSNRCNIPKLSVGKKAAACASNSTSQRQTRSSANKSQNYKSLVCPVCLDLLMFENPRAGKQVMSTNCGHVFCETCIKCVMESTKTCSICRKRLTVKSIHPLFVSMEANKSCH